MPPKVEYRLTPKGRSFIPVIAEICDPAPKSPVTSSAANFEGSTGPLPRWLSPLMTTPPVPCIVVGSTCPCPASRNSTSATGECQVRLTRSAPSFWLAASVVISSLAIILIDVVLVKFIFVLFPETAI